mmetsp:Transcript_12892/g.19605  ORF Transcript_12892/g.19605 Transcript_12892/m.19605 type:complete len:204 (+) Transcript_12892:1516-2127(+)
MRLRIHHTATTTICTRPHHIQRRHGVHRRILHNKVNHIFRLLHALHSPSNLHATLRCRPIRAIAANRSVFDVDFGTRTILNLTDHFPASTNDLSNDVGWYVDLFAHGGTQWQVQIAARRSVRFAEEGDEGLGKVDCLARSAVIDNDWLVLGDVALIQIYATTRPSLQITNHFSTTSNYSTDELSLQLFRLLHVLIRIISIIGR